MCGLSPFSTQALEGGGEVRLQRNALQVLELPEGEVTYGSDDDASKPGTAAAVAAHPRRRRVRNRKRAPPAAPKAPPPPTKLNFLSLRPESLRKYRRHYRVSDVGPNASVEELAEAIARHFTVSQKTPSDESKLLESFVNMAQRVLEA